MMFGSLLCLLFIALILVLVTKSSEKFTKKDPMLLELHAILSKIHPKANDVTIDKGKKSYTVNKKDITLCLTDQDGEYYNKNIDKFGSNKQKNINNMIKDYNNGKLDKQYNKRIKMILVSNKEVLKKLYS